MGGKCDNASHVDIIFKNHFNMLEDALMRLAREDPVLKEKVFGTIAKYGSERYQKEIQEWIPGYQGR